MAAVFALKTLESREHWRNKNQAKVAEGNKKRHRKDGDGVQASVQTVVH